MKHFTPFTQQILDDGVEVDTLSTNLFKDTPIPSATEEKLQAYLRIRPIEEEDPPFSVLNATTLMANPPKSSKAFKHNKETTLARRNYTFSQIFDAKVGQQAFFNSCALPLVTKFLRGDNTLLFAYGTTSSGKSYTMQGNSLNPGVIPRSLTTIFKCLGDRISDTPMFKPSRFSEAQLVHGTNCELETSIRDFISDSVRSKSSSASSIRNFSNIDINITSDIMEESNILHPSNIGLRYNVWVSFIEFYKDDVKDLLAVDTGEKLPQILLVTDGNSNYFFKGIRHVFVASPEEAMKVLVYGQDYLHFAETNLNKHSSRSHCCFNVTLVAYDELVPVVHRVSNLSFCDLAGSERGNRTQNIGERMKEAGKINGSLSILSRCINILRQNQRKGAIQQVVPFRECKLTKMFQSYFNGTATSAIIVNINPSESYYDETLISLDFSAIASKVVVFNEENRMKAHESFARLTQIWMQSTQRWSTFAPHRPPQASMSTIISEPICETTEVDLNDSASALAEAESKFEAAKALMDSLITDPETDNDALEVFREHIEALYEKLNGCQNEKFDVELRVRAEVAKEMNEIVEQLTTEHSDAQAKAKQSYEKQLERRTALMKHKFKTEQDFIVNEKRELEERAFQFEEELIEKAEEIEKLKAELVSINAENLRLKTKSESRTEAISTFSQTKELVTVDSSMNTSVSTISRSTALDKETMIEISKSDKFSCMTPNHVKPLAFVNSETQTDEYLNFDLQRKIDALKQELHDAHGTMRNDASKLKDNETKMNSQMLEISVLKKKEAELQKQLMQKQTSALGLLNKDYSVNSFKDFKRATTKVQESHSDPDPYMKLQMCKEETNTVGSKTEPKKMKEQENKQELSKQRKTRKRKPVKVEISSSSNSDSDSSDKDEITNVVFESQRKAKRTRSREDEEKKIKESTRKKLLNRSLMQSISPVKQDADQDVISHTGRKLRSRRTNAQSKKTSKKKLFDE